MCNARQCSIGPQLETVSMREVLPQVNPSGDCELIPFARELFDAFVYFQCMCACVQSLICLFH